MEEMTYKEILRLENICARALRTQRRFIRIDKILPRTDKIAVIRVIYRGFTYLLTANEKYVLQIAREVI